MRRGAGAGSQEGLGPEGKPGTQENPPRHQAGERRGRDYRGVGKAGAQADGVQVLNARTFPRSSLSVPLPPPR